MLINCHYPIDANSFVLQYGIIVKKSRGAARATLAMQTAIGLGDFVKMGFEQDVEIWKNKARIDNPLLCEEDGPVYQLRRWYEQFYVDVADVQPDMVDRFEFEIDTTSPHEAVDEGSRGEHRRRAARCGNGADGCPARQPARRRPRWCRSPASRCGARVLARKSSWNQTSVQWNAEASARCQERRDAQNLAAHSARGLFLACSALARFDCRRGLQWRSAGRRRIDAGQHVASYA